MCLAESAIHSQGLGASVRLDVPDSVRLDAALFGEAQSRVVLTVKESDEAALADVADRWPVSLHRLGIVNSGRLVLHVGAETIIDTPVEPLKTLYEAAIPDKMRA